MNGSIRSTFELVGIAAVVFAAICAPAFGQEDPGFPTPTGDPSILAEGARLERLFSKACFTEGVAVAPDGKVYFSDITFTKTCRSPGSDLPEAGHIWVYDPTTGAATIFRSPSGMSNGLKFDAAGNLIAAEGADFGGQRVTRTDMETGRSFILAGLHDGHPFNAPNDLTIDDQGRIYFSDPRYLGHEPIEQDLMAVYRIDPDGSVHRVVTDAGKPNGVLVSPDQRTLYVVSNDDGVFDGPDLETGEAGLRGAMVIWAYDLAEDGTVSNKRLFHDFAPEVGADGLAADENGNVYAAVRRTDAPGIYVFSPEGKQMAFIPTGTELPTNMGFGRGEDSSLLYVTSGNSLYRIRLNATGYHLPQQ